MAGTERVDLRSDTVTRPTRAMREAMARAEVGDDVFGEDPTCNELEALGAQLTGFEAALFVPSGTMGNQIALNVHCEAGTEVICESSCHILKFERAAMAAISGLLPRIVVGDRGIMDPAEVLAVHEPGDVVHAATGCIALENTHNMAGGRVMPLERMRELVEVSRDCDVPIHLDGARLFNGALALGAEPSEIARGADSVMFCLSKGLGAPAGSLLCGSAGFIERARQVRKMLGGGMRQAGVLAAAGLVALRENRLRLAEDHALAAEIAENLSRIEGLEIPDSPDTNILMVRVTEGYPHATSVRPAEGLVARFARHDVHAFAMGVDIVRLVTHYDLPPDSAARVAEAAA